MARAAGEADDEAALAFSRRKRSTRARRPAAKAGAGALPPRPYNNGHSAAAAAGGNGGDGGQHSLPAARMGTAEVLELEAGTLEVLASMQAAAADSRRVTA